MESNKVLDILHTAKASGIDILLNEGRLQLRVGHNQSINDVLLQQIKEYKNDIIDFLSDERWQSTRAKNGSSDIPSYNRSQLERIPLSYFQERLWFIHQLKGSADYHLSWIFRLSGKTDVKALEAAFRTIVDRHEILRTVIREENGEGYQVINPPALWQMESVHAAEIGAEYDGVQKYLEARIQQPFDLSSDSMLKVVLINNAQDEKKLLVVLHHIAFDGWSIGIIVKELTEIYQSIIKQRAPELNALPVQYADYAIWQRQFLSGDKLNTWLAYWKGKLKEVEPLALLTDHERTIDAGTAGGIVHRMIDAETTSRLINLSQQEGATLFMTLLAIYNVLLYRYTGQPLICVGIPTAARRQPEVENLIGFFVNTLAVCNDLGNDPDFRNLLEQVKRNTLDAYHYQEVPFEKIVEALGIDRDLTRNPLFQVTFALQNAAGDAAELDLGELELHEEPRGVQSSKFDFSFDVTESAAGLQLSVTYSKAIFTETTMNRLLDHYIRLTEAVLKDPAVSISSLPMLTAEEERQLAEFEHTSFPYPDNTTVAAAFTQQAMQTPEAIALEGMFDPVTYSQLNKKADDLAAYLQAQGIQPGEKIALLSYREPNMIIGMLGILKAGCTYVPFHITYPAGRIKYIIENAGISCILHTNKDLFQSTGLTGYLNYDISDIPHASQNENGITPAPGIPAYIMYTSGTTGTPKGIIVSHKNILKLVYEPGVIAVYRSDRMLQWSNYAFDGSIYEIFAALLNGASLYLIKDDFASDATALSRIIQQEKITVCFVTTALFNGFVDVDPSSLAGLRKLLFGGEKVSVPHVRKALAILGSGKIVHVYGPTETTVYATCYPVDAIEEKEQTIPIGRGLANTSIRILDEQGKPVPPGIAGEIFIGGDGVSMGYSNNDSLNRSCFLPLTPNGRWYRTGDFARWRSDGNVEYLGRKDNQVKVRGYRIELAEIENWLQQSPGIKQSVVVVKEDARVGKELIAYVVADKGFDRLAVFTFLKNRLPEYMIPALLVQIEQLPLNSNGKVDRKKLPDIDPAARVSATYVAPRNETEQLLAIIWQELLGIPRISIHDNFFRCGGHSLLAMRMIAAIRNAFEKTIPIKNIFLYPTISSLASCLSTWGSKSNVPAIGAWPREEKIPLSFSQERLWFLDRFQGSLQYHMPWRFRLSGNLNVMALEASFREIIKRHEVLRTVFREEDGIAYQVITSYVDWKMDFLNQAELESTGANVEQYLRKKGMQPFDLSADTMLKVTLIQLTTGEYLLFVLLHHIAFDGWSIKIMVEELVELYQSQIENRLAALKELPVQYADYAIWQRKYLAGSVLAEKLEYWKEQLRDVAPLDLATDHPRPAEQSIKGGFEYRWIDKARRDEVIAFVRQEGVTLFMMMLSIFKVLLYRYTGQRNICVGAPSAGRQQQEIEGLIGFFINTLALRTSLEDRFSFRDVLQLVKRTTLEAYEHQDVPFEKIVETLGIERDRSRNAIFQVWLVLQNMPESDDIVLNDVGITRENSGQITSQFELNLDIAESPQGIFIGMTYCSALFENATIVNMLQHFENLLAAVVKDAGMPISTLPLLCAEERNRLTTEFSSSGIQVVKEGGLAHWFSEQANATPHAIALVSGADNITYGELEERANRLAHFLREKGVREESIVALCLTRGTAMIVSILGVLKAGGAYLPIDPQYPESRKQYMLSDAKARLLLCEAQLHQWVQSHEVTVVHMDQEQELMKDYPSTALEHNTGAQQLAYIIYTSGSTGKPKGVMIEHRSVMNLIAHQSRTFGISADERILQFSNYCFDASVEQIFLALLNGATLVLINEELLLDHPRLYKLLREQRITHLHATPGFLESLEADSYGGLRRVIAGGEACKRELALRWNGLADFYNEYGPTETTVTAIEICCRQQDTLEGDVLPIGRPLSNTQVYLLDEQHQPVPIGVAGELYIGGVQLARGYLNQPALTAERFIENPFGEGRLYRSGDLAKWLPNGNIVFLGRRDSQVKVRGYRIELGEVEEVLLQAPGIRQSVVIAGEDRQGHQRLVAYVVADEFNREAILEYVGKELPDYMIPAYIERLDHIPLTSNGKVDTRQLPAVDMSAATETGYEAPRNEMESKLAVIWSELLEAGNISINDNFFALGGHSLMAVRVVAAIRKEFNVDIPIVTLFENPTIALLASQIAISSPQPQLPQITPRAKIERLPLSYSQERLWFIDRLQGSVQYHMPWVFRLRGELDTAALETSFRMIVQRHEVLRTVIREHQGVGYQQILEPEQWHMDIIDAFTILVSGETVKEFINNQIIQPFDLSSNLPLRITLIRQSEQEYLMVAVVHHIAFDGWSIGILVEELVELYRSHKEGSTAVLKPLAVQYADYALWQREQLPGSMLEKKLNYWKQQLQDVARLELPTDYPRPLAQSIKGGGAGRIFSKELKEELIKLSQQQGATLFMTLLAAFKILLARYSGQQDICIGTAVAGRQQKEIEGIIGFFINTLALRTHISSDASMVSILQAVKQTTLQGFSNQEVPLEKIVEAIGLTRDRSHTPIFQVLFTLQNAPASNVLDLAGIELTTEPSGEMMSQFDLILNATEMEQGLHVGMSYCSDLFSAATINRMLDHYEVILWALVNDKQQTIGAINLLSNEERAQLTSWSQGEATDAGASTVPAMFEEQVICNTQAEAVIHGSERLSYSQLNAKAQQIARQLQAKAVVPGELIALCTAPGPELVAAILGIWKAGAAYVPVDPAWPAARRQELLEDAGCRIVIADAGCAQELLSWGYDVITTDAISNEQNGELLVPVAVMANQLAYVLYTSGSSGKPKGVMVSHGSLHNYIVNSKKLYIDQPARGSYVHLSFTFDASLTALWAPLVSGLAIVIGEGSDAALLQAHSLLQQAPYNFIKLTPAHLPLLAQTGVADITNRLVIGGEALSAGQLAPLAGSGVQVVNEYGPTEATVGCCVYIRTVDELLNEATGAIPIGKPMDNVRLYIVDEQGSLAPVGVAGELWIGGVQVAQGYWKRPELTAEKFMADPFSKEAGARVYRSGDRCRWLADGNIEFLGRMDEQIKIRGYRIEPGEIEHALSRSEGVVAAKVLVNEANEQQQNELNAYLLIDAGKYPLLYNYQRLLRLGEARTTDLHVLPNGLPVFNSNSNEVHFLYKEIFEEGCYLRHGLQLTAQSCVVDVGANTGFFTLFIHVLFPGIRVYSCEPIPAVYQYLCQNRKLYGIAGKSFELALFNTEGVIDFNYFPDVTVVSGISNDHEKVREAVRSYITHTGNAQTGEQLESLLDHKLKSTTIQCKTRTLSQLIAEEDIEKIDLLKIDVENSEQYVLEGIAAEDWAKIESIIIEVHNVNGRMQHITQLLEGHGYNVIIEKEASLGHEDILYNLFAHRKPSQDGVYDATEMETRCAQGWIDPQQLIEQVAVECRSNLPAYMIPHALILVDHFPLTTNGKLDKKALLKQQSLHQGADTVYIAPSNPIEQSLAGIWEELLEITGVSITANFFELGGHSLLAVRLIAAVRSRMGKELTIKQVFDHPTIAGMALLLSAPTEDVKIPAIVPANRTERIPLSYSQERLWFIDRLQGSVQYHMPWVFRLQGELDIPALENAFRTIIERHTILRTVIREEEGTAYQVVNAAEGWTMNYVAGQFGPQDPGLSAFIRNIVNVPYDLSNDPILKVTCIRLSHQENILIVLLHHIAFDGWSTGILVNELVQLYKGYREGNSPQLPQLPVQYADFAVWQREYVSGERLQAKLNYWKDQLKDVKPLDLGAKRFNRDEQADRADMAFRILNKEKLNGITALARREGITPFMVLLAAFKVLLSRYTGEEDICVGTPAAGRQHQETESLIGFFINTLALRTRIDQQASFSSLLQHVKRTTLEAFEHQEVPFEKIVEALDIERDLERNPLFQVMFTLQNTPEGGDLDLGGVQLSAMESGELTAQFPIHLSITERGGELQLVIVYSIELFTKENINALLVHYETLLTAIMLNSNEIVGRLNILPGEEVQMLHNFNNTYKAYAEDESLIGLFEKQAAKDKNAAALFFDDNRLTYGELEKRATLLAQLLLAKGVKENDIIPVIVERSPELVIAILAVLKAGAAYIALEPGSPPEKINYILGDIAASVLITASAYQEQVHIPEEIIKVFVDSATYDPAEQITFTGINRLHNAVCCVIYTSGTSGRPKGVTITNKGILNRLYWMWEAYPFTAEERSALKTSVEFVDHIWEMFGPLLRGIPSVLFSRDEVLDQELFIHKLSLHRITRLVVVPSLLRSLLDKIETDGTRPEYLQYCTCSGQALMPGLADNFHRLLPHCRLLNIYGSTEVTADVTCYDAGTGMTAGFENLTSSLISQFLESGEVVRPVNFNGLPAIYYDVSINRQWTPDEYAGFLQNELLPYLVNVSSPGFAGHMTGRMPAFMRNMSELMIALNQNLVKTDTSGAATAIERQVLAIFHKQIYRFHHDFYRKHMQHRNACLGIITNGGTLSNITALSYALNKALPPAAAFGGVAEEGLIAAIEHYGYKGIAVIGSELMHYSIGKALRTLGIGKRACVLVDFDERDPLNSRESLSREIEKLIENNILILAIIGVAGATETGEADPLTELGSIAAKYNIHFHVDAAFGGVYAFSSRLSQLITGIEMADTVTICGHKQLLLPLGASICLFKSPSLALYSENNSNYQARKESFDLGKYTIEGSRPFVSLLFHAMLRLQGEKELGMRVEANHTLTLAIAEKISSNKAFELVRAPRLNMIVYRYLPEAFRNGKEITASETIELNTINKRIQQAQFEEGRFFTSYTELNDKRENGNHVVVLRMVLMNAAITEQYIDQLLEDQIRIGDVLSAGNEYLPLQQPVSTNRPYYHNQLATVPIGKPIANTEVYILSRSQQLCPVGIPGEIYIGGSQVADGYINLPALTAERFITGNITGAGDKRLYRTGDIGRWLSDGNIEYLGRIDDQVKVRGHRVEPKEIEMILCELPYIHEAVVLAGHDKDHEPRLTAYIVSNIVCDVDFMIGYLRNRLPDHMIPAAIVQLPALPLTASGKVDKKKLPQVIPSPIETTGYEAPRTALEWQLVRIWQELLELSPIGVHENFFRLGGHSLMIMRMVAAVRKRIKKDMAVRDIFDQPTIRLLAKKLVVSADQTTQLLTGLRHHYELIPLSFAQERLWFIDQLQGSTQYHMPWVFNVSGPLQPALLNKAFQMIVDRHEILRTVLREKEGKGYQVITPAGQWKMKYMREEEVIRQGYTIEDHVKTFVNNPFDLARDPMFNVLLIQQGEDQFVLTILLHHIAFDGWSIGIAISELVELYRSLAENRLPVLKELPLQYADFSIWQRQYLSGNVLQEKLAYWKEQLRDVTPLNMITDYQRSAEQEATGGVVYQEADKDILEKLNELARQEGVTLFMLLLSLFKVLLYRYTGENDICVGTPVAGRQLQEVEGLIGFFVNTLALRSQVKDDITLAEFLKLVKETCLSAFENQEVPFEKVVESLEVERDLSRTPVFQVMFALMNVPKGNDLELGDNIQLQSIYTSGGGPKFDLNLTVAESPNHLALNLQYRSDLFEPGTMNQLLQHYKNLLQDAVQNFNSPVSSLTLLSVDEEERLLREFSSTGIQKVQEGCLAGWFSRQAQETPNATALVWGKEELTYRQLDERSNRLGHYLREKDISEESVVALCLPRGTAMIIAILGVLKAGAAYLPIDPAYPESRKKYLLSDAAAALLICEEQSGNWALPEKIALVYMNKEEELLGKYPVTAVQRSTNREHLAYILYTSGSTGKPKGVMIEHGAVMNLITHQSRAFGITANDRILQFSNYCFDVSVEQIFLALLNGATLVLMNEEQLLDQEQFYTLLREQRITHLNATPGFLERLEAGSYGGLRRVVASGETCKRELALRWKGLADFYNDYGPTEATVIAIKMRCEQPETLKGDVLPIGKPLSNMQVYLLNEQRDPVPVGVAGELYIGGVQLARGYLNQPDLTAERFIKNPFGEGRLYRTGDMAKWLPDGNIVFLGRHDNQVKIRGYRIESGEVEAALLQAPGVKQAVVTAAADQLGYKRLIAYVVTDRFDREAIIHHLKMQLPDYMLPSHIEKLDEIPLTSNGKTDSRRLPAVNLSVSAQAAYEPPRNETESGLAAIWGELLDVERIGIHDNFFALGGHSLLLIQLLHKIRERGYTLQLRDIFAFPTIAEQAALIQQREPAARATLRHHLVAFHTTGNGAPVFIMPGSDGVVEGYKDLAQPFYDIHPVYGIQMQGILPGEEPLHTITAMAERNIALIRQVQPAGPYRFIGHSFGGHVAYEMCYQLEQAGEHVELLTLLDVSSTLYDYSVTANNETDFIMDLAAGIFGKDPVIANSYFHWADELREQLNNTTNNLPQQLGLFLKTKFPDKDEAIDFMTRLLQLRATNLSIGHEAQGTVRAAILVIQAADGGAGAQRQAMGWENKTRGIITTSLQPGDHFSMVTGDNGMATGRYIQEIIDSM